MNESDGLRGQDQGFIVDWLNMLFRQHLSSAVVFLIWFYWGGLEQSGSLSDS